MSWKKWKIRKYFCHWFEKCLPRDYYYYIIAQENKEKLHVSPRIINFSGNMCHLVLQEQLNFSCSDTYCFTYLKRLCSNIIMTVLLFILNFDPVTFTSRKVFYGLTKDVILINRQKSGFYKRSAAFVGCLTEKGTVKRCTHKTGEKVNFPVPKNKDVLWSFLGVVGFFKKFIPDSTVNCEPLLHLLKKFD